MASGAEEAVRQFGPALARIAASYERNRALREELVQDMLLAIVSSLPRLREPSKLRAFVFRIAHNRAVRHVVKRVREPAFTADSDEIAGETPTQEQAMIAGERTSALLEAVRKLSLPYRQVITLLLEDLSYPEISEVLGITPVNVGVRVNRAKQQLRTLLDDR